MFATTMICRRGVTGGLKRVRAGSVAKPQRGFSKAAPVALEKNGTGMMFKTAAIGVAGGAAGSMVGLGGGFVVIPLLTRYAGFSQHAAHATSLFGVAATSAGSAYGFWKNGYLEFNKELAALSVGACVSVIFGAKFAVRLSGPSLKRGLGIALMAVAPLIPARDHIIEAMQAFKKPEDEPAQSMNPGVAENKRALNLFFLGNFSGFLAGLLGIGGGAVMVPCLSFLTNLSTHSVIGTSLASMMGPSLLGSFQHYRNGHLSPRLAVPVACGTLLGSYLGAELVAFVPERELRIVFAVMMGFMGGRMVWPKKVL